MGWVNRDRSCFSLAVLNRDKLFFEAGFVVNSPALAKRPPFGGGVTSDGVGVNRLGVGLNRLGVGYSSWREAMGGFRLENRLG